MILIIRVIPSAIADQSTAEGNFLLLNYSIKTLFLINKNGIIELDLQP